uniref:Uncharacterized protein n=1 Tax=Anguilla anguilla TaxID=7936 RepID=A0A0E9RAK7_ANGAN
MPDYRFRFGTSNEIAVGLLCKGCGFQTTLTQRWVPGRTWKELPNFFVSECVY